jgi:hypothetical protein
MAKPTSEIRTLEVPARLDGTLNLKGKGSQPELVLTKDAGCFETSMYIIEAATHGLLNLAIPCEGDYEEHRLPLVRLLVVHIASIMSTSESACKRLFSMLVRALPERFGMGFAQENAINTMLNIQRMISLRPTSEEDARASGISMEAVSTAIAESLAILLATPHRSRVIWSTLTVIGHKDTKQECINKFPFYHDSSEPIDQKTLNLLDRIIPDRIAASSGGDQMKDGMKHYFAALVKLTTGRLPVDPKTQQVKPEMLDKVRAMIMEVLIRILKKSIELHEIRKITKNGGKGKGKAVPAPKNIRELIEIEPNPANYIFWTTSFETARVLDIASDLVRKQGAKAVLADMAESSKKNPDLRTFRLKDMHVPDVRAVLCMILNNYLTENNLSARIPIGHIWLAYIAPTATPPHGGSQFMFSLGALTLATYITHEAMLQAQCADSMPFFCREDQYEYTTLPYVKPRVIPLKVLAVDRSVKPYESASMRPFAGQCPPAPKKDQEIEPTAVSNFKADIDDCAADLDDPYILTPEQLAEYMRITVSMRKKIKADKSIRWLLEPSTPESYQNKPNIWRYDPRMLKRVVAVRAAIIKATIGSIGPTKTNHLVPAATPASLYRRLIEGAEARLKPEAKPKKDQDKAASAAAPTAHWAIEDTEYYQKLVSSVEQTSTLSHEEQKEFIGEMARLSTSLIANMPMIPINNSVNAKLLKGGQQLHGLLYPDDPKADIGGSLALFFTPVAVRFAMKYAKVQKAASEIKDDAENGESWTRYPGHSTWLFKHANSIANSSHCANTAKIYASLVAEAKRAAKEATGTANADREKEAPASDGEAGSDLESDEEDIAKVKAKAKKAASKPKSKKQVAKKKNRADRLDEEAEGSDEKQEVEADDFSE